jgi:hypothetical protein
MYVCKRFIMIDCDRHVTLVVSIGKNHHRARNLQALAVISIA